MKKVIFSFLTLALAFGASAQTIVSTTPENRKVVLEEFTGINCTWCPDGHKTANNLAAANPGNVSIINIHQGGFAASTYTTQWGNALANQYSISSYPNATVNRGATSSSDRSVWTTWANNVLATPSCVNIATTATVDVATRVMNVHVEVYYTDSAEGAVNFLNIALVQDSVYGSQVGGSQLNPDQVAPDGSYIHMHMLRDLLTGQWGDTLKTDGTTTIPAGTYIEKDYTYTIPEQLGSPNPIPTELGNLHIVAFITKDHKTIYTGTTVTPTYNFPTEITLVDKGVTFNPMYGCNDSIQPIFKVQNYSGTPITSMTINYTGAAAPFQWTGNLNSLSTTSIELDPLQITLGQNETISITIDNVNGDSPASPYLSASGTVNKPILVEGHNRPVLHLATDAYGSETAWGLFTVDGTLIQQGGPYEDLNNVGTTPHTIPLNITEPGCYIFQIIDGYGDGINSTFGAGNYRIVDGNGTTLISSNGQYGAGEIKEMHIVEITIPEDAVSINSMSLTSCNDAASPTLIVTNEGSNAITSLTISYTGSENPVEWTGNIAPLATGTIHLAPVIVPLNQNTTINVNITAVNGTTLATPVSTSGTITATAPQQGQFSATLYLKPDAFGTETTWFLYNTAGELIQQGGPYEDITTAADTSNIPTKEIPLNGIVADGCYTFEILDAYGDGINNGYGSGNYSIKDANGTILASSNGKYGAGESKTFTISGLVGLENVSGSIYQTLLYPNPAMNSTTLEISASEGSMATINVVDMLGRDVIVLGNKALKAGNNHIEINTSALNNGVYFVRVATANGTATKKLIIKK
ncbi:MAG: Omp28-related outer membrane protein [Bacteroidales bacterium]|jgi:hypothetical protein|nr:Omp28-related outer membrane protein [Bacteroidales bacterium]